MYLLSPLTINNNPSSSTKETRRSYSLMNCIRFEIATISRPLNLLNFGLSRPFEVTALTSPTGGDSYDFLIASAAERSAEASRHRHVFVGIEIRVNYSPPSLRDLTDG